MKTYNLFRFTQKDMIKANRIGSREASIENSIGFVSSHKVHKSKKVYSRKNYKIDVREF